MVKTTIRRWISLVRRARVGGTNVQIGANVHMHGMPLIVAEASSTIRVGNDVVLTSHSRSTALGVAHQVVLRTMRPNATIEIGDHCGLSGTTICAAQSVTIGEGTLLGADVIVSDTDFHPVDSKARRYAPPPLAQPEDAVVIGPNVFIGARSIVLKGVQIGANSVVGAGSVVTRSIPANSIAAGNPARVIRRIEELDREGLCE